MWNLEEEEQEEEKENIQQIRNKYGQRNSIDEESQEEEEDLFEFEPNDIEKNKIENNQNNKIELNSLETPTKFIKEQSSNISTILDNTLIEKDISKINSILLNSRCFSVIPSSSKIVVLDTSLAVKSAFKALEENNIKSAPLWDSKQQKYVGIITVSDFIQILLYFHSKDPKMNIFQELEKHKISTWRG